MIDVHDDLVENNLHASLPRSFEQIESSSSQALQTLIYFNIFLSLIFLVIESIAISHKINNYELDFFDRTLGPLTFAVWSVTETFRLYYGYSGNIREILPTYLVFLVFSVFPQLPCLIFIMQFQSLRLPVENVLGYVVFSFTIIELLLSYQATKYLLQKQVSDYITLIDPQDEEDSNHIQTNKIRIAKEANTLPSYIYSNPASSENQDQQNPLLE